MSETNKLTKKEVKKAFWRWMFFSHANYNYERLQSTGVAYALSPILKKIYKDDPEQLSEALSRHLQFFNTEPSFGGPILSVSIAMEEQKAEGEPIEGTMVESFKTGLMGPIAGVGDSLFQGTLIPILLSLTIPFGSSGNIIMGPVAYGVLLLGIMLPLARWLWLQGYYTGRKGVTELLRSSLLQKVMFFCKYLGAIVMGALAASFVEVSTSLQIPLGSDSLDVQEQILDTLLLGILPLGITLGTYWMLKRRMKPTTVLVVLILIGVIGGAFGIIE
ncbi:PTS system mannose/fructose/sorbose family transporter subunit IID [Tetragenococcus halophilus]|uniref:PTS system mannose/fructose/sorbose family transporter subunit IID n=1 Tax=Tetragenococcus halophilus TaxID=51669 RepID=UPI000CC072EB|nr:PTS system mannose/fructose/sorbose family transporter subunit IID [Tetragenococcus halophilus]MDN6268666.1 PTS system mannose/fructose/sorbose family transporter subunit IID [Tetragenococcus koreensis]MDN6751339.1 PTS system mannose/fructose/sorbose family transporter subunit IID [Staphylococcus equorum]MCO8285043.1 PTS system mannose/fructose/sorbose family transporter subunit IID [Tetragenococcus halophilus]MCO8292071.1 PTS system mannose/fructose/sorbose family transporter subunit IID [T